MFGVYHGRFLCLSEPGYKGTICQKNYWKMTIFMVIFLEFICKIIGLGQNFLLVDLQTLLL